MAVPFARAYGADNKELNRSFHRHVVSPDDDVSGEDARVKSVADALWTPEVIAAYKAAHPVSPEVSA